MRLSDPRPDGSGVDVSVDGERRRFTWTWLRDHARDPGSYYAAGAQRLVSAATVEAAGPATARVTPDGAALEVEWPEGPHCSFPATLLAEVGPTSRSAHPIRDRQVPWTRAERHGDLCRVDARDLLDDESAVGVALDAFSRDGVFLVVGIPTHLEATRAVLERIGYVRRTIFGDVWQYASDGGYDDTASTSLEITPHTDGTYSVDAPGLLALHCHRYEATGGDNVLVDGLAAAERLARTDPAAAEVLRTEDIPARYIGDGAHLVAARPVLRSDDDGVVQVSYNHHDRAPFHLPEPRMSEVYAALHRFDRTIREPDLTVDVALRPGEMLLLDNWRVLHGRREFRGHRQMAGGYLNREDVESRLRGLRDRGLAAQRDASSARSTARIERSASASASERTGIENSRRSTRPA